MTFLPIAQRELRIASRKPGTYRLRWIFALVVLVIWFVVLVTSRNSVPVAERGRMLFISIAVLAFAFCLFAGLVKTADCLSEEKREGTLGLLFLTELKGYDVVLGKLFATSLHAFYGLLAILPLLSLPLLIGGVTVGEFWRMTIALIATLLLSLAVGMFVSVFSHDSRQAFGMTFLVLLCLSALPFALARLAAWLAPAPWGFLLLPSPVGLYIRAFESYYKWGLGPRSYLLSLLVILSIAAAALVLAAAWLRTAWQEKGPRQKSPRRVEFWRRWSYVLAHSPTGRLWLAVNPILWLCARDRRPARLAGCLISLLVIVWAGFLVGLSSNRVIANECFTVCMFMALAMHIILKLLIALEASRRFNEDRRSSALELLLVTPLPVREILAGQVRALQRAFLWPVLVLIAMNFTFLWVVAVFNPLHMNGDGRLAFCEVDFGGAVILLADAFALSWVGMWMGLRKRRHQLAVLATLLRIILPPWAAFFLFFFFLMAGRRGPSEGDMAVYVLCWFLLGFALDLAAAAHASFQLRHSLRDAAHQTHAAPPFVSPHLQADLATSTVLHNRA